jgi:hypothetical protein
MKHIQNGLAASVLVICFSAPAMAAGARGTGPMMRPMSTNPMMTNHTTTTTPLASTPRALGQPNQSCGSANAPNTPGNAASAPGSAFNPNGTAGMMYAGQQPQNSRNPASVAQYDVARSHQPR